MTLFIIVRNLEETTCPIMESVKSIMMHPYDGTIKKSGGTSVLNNTEECFQHNLKFKKQFTKKYVHFDPDFINCIKVYICIGRGNEKDMHSLRLPVFMCRWWNYVLFYFVCYSIVFLKC